MKEERPKAITQGCWETVHCLKNFPGLGEFYLAGGTALALTLEHRISVDLDLFSPTNPLGLVERQNLRKDLSKIGITTIEEKERTLHAVRGNTHLSFFQYDCPLLKPARLWEGIRLAHPLDIGLMKIAAIIGRGSKKDFIDLFVILWKGLSLRQLFRLAPKKFKDVHDFRIQACRALVYFEDADLQAMPKMLMPLSWPQVKSFFENEVRSIARSSRIVPRKK